jgi:hypothetical protein
MSVPVSIPFVGRSENKPSPGSRRRDEPVEIIISITRSPLTPHRELARREAMDAILEKVLRLAA